MENRRPEGATLCFADLDESQKQPVQALLHTEAYREAESLMRTTYERGIEQGRHEAESLMKTTYERGMMQGKRQSALLIMEARFGPLSPEITQRVETLLPEALDQLLLDLLKAQTLEDLHLDG